MCGVIAIYSERPDVRWCAAAAVLARHHDLVITDEHGAVLRQLLQEVPCSVWIEGPSHSPVRRILVAIDPFADPEVTAALASDTCALAEGTRAELLALHAWDAPGHTLLARYDSAARAAEYIAAQRERARAATAGVLHRAGVSPTRTLCERGRATTAIVEAVERNAIDAVVLGITARPRLARAVLGCTAARVAELVACHVVVARAPTPPDARSLPRAIALRGAG